MLLELFAYLIVKLNFYAFKHQGIDLRSENINYLKMYVLVTFGLFAKTYTHFGCTLLTINYLYDEINKLENTTIHLKLIYIQLTSILSVLLNVGFILEIIGAMLLFLWVLKLFHKYGFKLLNLWSQYIYYVFEKIKYIFIYFRN